MFTADDTLLVTTTESVETTYAPIVTPGTTGSKYDPTTGSTITEVPVTVTLVTDSSTTSVPETEKPETPASGTPTTSAPTPEVTTAPKPAVSSSEQTTTTAQTPIPTPHIHSWSGWKVTKAATCTENGSQRRTCSGCNEVQNQSIPATGHSWGEWKVTTEPTTTTEGIEIRTCSKCKNIETRKIEKLPAENASPADCEWMADYFLQLYNNERAKLGVQQLVTDAKLHEMAQVRADELAVSFDHFRPDGRNGGTVFDDFKYGIYHDFTVVGLPASYNYYEPEYANEAIGAYVYSGSITPKEIIVQSVLEALKSHEAHWSYMKDDIYGAVGIAVSAKKSEEYPGYYEFYFEVLLSDRLYD